MIVVSVIIAFQQTQTVYTNCFKLFYSVYNFTTIFCICTQSGNVAGAWLSWTGGSLVLCLFAVMTVLIEPAAASSGIPGLIAYLNGVEPKGGKSPLTGK